MNENQGKKILIAEDLKVFSLRMEEALSLQGYDVRVARDGEQALEMSKEFKPDLMILDIMLPKLHGIELIKRSQHLKNEHGFGFIICTTKRFKSELDQLERLGVYDFISKPFDVKDLLKTVSNFFADHNSVFVEKKKLVQNQNHQSEEVSHVEFPSNSIQLQIWGCRGSIPVSGSRFLHYGGSTSCFSVETEDNIYIFDAGTGIRELGLKIASAPKRKKIHLFITHTHWDHIQGFPFFVPAYQKDSVISVYGAKGFGKDLEAIFRRQLDQDYFPVQLDEMQAEIRFHYLNGPVNLDDCTVYWEFVNHPGATVAYRIHIDGKAIVWMPDNEFLEGYMGKPDDVIRNNDIISPYMGIVNFISKADILIAESQYTNEEYKSKVTWGHTSMSNSCVLARLAEVERWIVIHHDPLHDDKFLHDKYNLTKYLLNKMDFDCDFQFGFERWTEML